MESKQDGLSGGGSGPPPKLLELGRTLRARREQLGLSLAKAGHGRCSHAHLSKVERGLEWPSPQLVVSLEVALSVPQGTFLAMLGEAEEERWQPQTRYRSTAWWGTARSAADTYTRHFISRSEQPPSPIIPKIVEEYGVRTTAPYVVIGQAIGYVVNQSERRARTRIAYTIEALTDAVTLFRFTRSHPVGRMVERVDLAVVEGGELAEVERHGTRHFMYSITLSHELAAGQQHRLVVATQLSGLAVPPGAYVNQIDQASHPVEMVVVFESDPPASLWWFEDLPFDAVPGMASASRLLTLDHGRTSKSFRRPEPRLAHGIGWTW